MYELIIIGGGPAATAAAVYAARKQLNTLLITAEFGGQSVVSETIYNWIGTPEISGADLAQSFKDHVGRYTESGYLTVVEGVYAESVTRSDAGFTVHAEGKDYTAATLLIATGSKRRQLDIPTAAQFEHKGITYCASCDGPMFAGMDVAVIGGGNSAFETAAQLLAYAKSVTLLQHRDTFKAEPSTVEKVLAHPNMKAYLNASITTVHGEQFVSGLTFTDTTTNTETKLDVQGIFVEIGQLPNTGLVGDLVEKDPVGHIVVNPRNQQTTLPGIWAAGDCTDGMYHQNNIAAGDAVKAIEDIYLYLKAR